MHLPHLAAAIAAKTEGLIVTLGSSTTASDGLHHNDLGYACVTDVLEQFQADWNQTA